MTTRHCNVQHSAKDWLQLLTTGAALAAGRSAGSGAAALAARSLLLHGEGAVIFVLGTVRGGKIGCGGVSVVRVKAAGQPAEIGLSLQGVRRSVIRDEERQLKFERNHCGIRRVKMGVVVTLALFRDDRSKTAVVTVVVTLPGSFPAAGQLLLGVRILRRFLPLSLEAAPGQHPTNDDQNGSN